MSRNLGYTRKFIILKKYYCNMAGQNPKGHGKLEIRGIKGNISLNIENAEGDNFYDVAFIGKNTSETIGRIYTDENGKGKAELTLNLQELEAKGFPLEKINAILIIRGLNILLGGYVDKEDNSIERFIDGIKHDLAEQLQVEIEPVVEWREVEAIMPELELELEPEPEPELELELLQEAETNVEEEIEDIKIYQKQATEPTYEPLNEIIEALETPPEVEIIEVPDTPPEVEIIEVPETPLEVEIIEIPEIPPEIEIIEALETPPEVKIIEVPDTPPEVEIIEVPETPLEIEVIEVQETPLEVVWAEEPEREPDNFWGEEVAIRKNQKNQTTNYILNILRFFPYVDPFSVKLQGYNWWKINFQEDVDTRGFLPYFSYIVGGSQKIKRTEEYITALDLLRKYEHYIFGLYNVNDDIKYYVYGIPGSYIKSEHPHNGTTGFNTWFDGLELDGYWLLYIDPLTGKIIYPANPMEPTN